MVKSIKIPKCRFHKKYMNIYGQIFHLSLMKEGNVMNVTLKQHTNVRLHFMFYIFTLLMGIVSFHFNLLGSTTFIVIGIILGVLVYLKSGSITEETFMVIEPVGYQINTKYFIGQRTTFIPYEQVKNIFINEVIFRQRIIYSLTILTNGTNDNQLIPLFMGFKPRINCLQYIFKELHEQTNELR